MKRLALITGRVLALVLLFTPTWVAAYLAAQPDYEPALEWGMGLAFGFWAGASCVGWLLTIVLHWGSRSYWVRTILGSVAALAANVAALFLLSSWNEVKCSRYFMAHRAELTAIGNELLAGTKDIHATRDECRKRNIITVPIRFVDAQNCCWVAFYRSGALDSQTGYYYRSQQNSGYSGTKKPHKIDDCWRIGMLAETADLRLYLL